VVGDPMTRILLVDDCEEIREAVVDLLEESGYEVEAAAGPESAWRLCERESFDLILCDLVMPGGGLSGPDAGGEGSPLVGLNAIREFSRRYPNTPIVAVSGQLRGGPIRGSERFGTVRTLSKPFGRDELISAIEGALEAGRAMRQSS